MYFEKLKGKVKVNITIDSTLQQELEKIKDREGIPSLSPMINQMLWEWIELHREKQNE